MANDRKTAKIHREVEQAIQLLHKHRVLRWIKTEDKPEDIYHPYKTAFLRIDLCTETSGADGVLGPGLNFYEDYPEFADGPWAINITKKTLRELNGR
jgi:hypothetical protein